MSLTLTVRRGEPDLKTQPPFQEQIIPTEQWPVFRDNGEGWRIVVAAEPEIELVTIEKRVVERIGVAGVFKTQTRKVPVKDAEKHVNEGWIPQFEGFTYVRRRDYGEMPQIKRLSESELAKHIAEGWVLILDSLPKPQPPRTETPEGETREQKLNRERRQKFFDEQELSCQKLLLLDPFEQYVAELQEIVSKTGLSVYE